MEKFRNFFISFICIVLVNTPIIATYNLKAELNTEINSTTIPTKKIVVFGAGYVGTVSGACFAKYGHSITFIEPNLEKVVQLNAGKSPILEPHLKEFLQEGVDKGLVQAKSLVQDELLDADFVMVAVPTPTTSEGILISEYLISSLTTINQASKQRSTPLIVVIRSTVPPNSIREIASQCFGERNTNIKLVMNPEFLRESTAIHDFFNPPFCVAGGDDKEAVEAVLSLYDNISPTRLSVSLETACLLKYSCNAFHALKIAFANEMACICEATQTDPTELMKVFCMDKILNCSPAYLKPGFSFGGSCLPKDLRALVALGKSFGDDLPLLSSVIPSNQFRFQKKADQILLGNHKKLAILGMSFKKNTDDLRDSPFIELIDYLHAKGIDLQIYDPDVNVIQLSGPQYEGFRRQYGYILPMIKTHLDEVINECDGVVLCKDILPHTSFFYLKERGILIYDLHYVLASKKLLAE